MIPTYDASYHAANKRLDELEADLDAAVAEFERLGKDAARKTTDAEKQFAKVFLGAQGAVDYRRQVALGDEEVSDMRYDARVAEHLVTTQGHALRKLHSKVDMQRTRVANARKELEVIQSGGRP